MSEFVDRHFLNSFFFAFKHVTCVAGHGEIFFWAVMHLLDEKVLPVFCHDF